MLDKNRIRLMTKMTAYEEGRAPEDQKISSYYKKDYVSFNTLIAALWVTLGYLLIAGLVVVVHLDALLNNLTMTKVITIAAVFFGSYIVLLVIYCVCTASFYRSKHNRAKHRTKRYYRDLAQLEKMTQRAKENQT